MPCITLTSAASSVVPLPRGQPEATRPPQSQDEDPAVGEGGQEDLLVDWDYWLSINPDIVAWLDVPGTSINYAVVQAPKDDPAFYLTHDIYRNPNPYGCPYVDAGCDGLNSLNVYVFGHNITYGTPMFAELARYSDKSFAKAHPAINLHTPLGTTALTVSSVSIVPGDEMSKNTAISSIGELQAWYAPRFAKADVAIVNDAEARQIITFVTCSYNYFSNERTLVSAQPETE